MIESDPADFPTAVDIATGSVPLPVPMPGWLHHPAHLGRDPAKSGLEQRIFRSFEDGSISKSSKELQIVNHDQNQREGL